MEDVITTELLVNLAFSVLGGLIVLIVGWGFRAYRRKQISEDIEFLEFEKKHLEAMKRSSIEMNRSAFSAGFFLLLLFGLANLLPRLLAYAGGGLISSLASLLTLVLWALFVGLCYKFWRRYDDLKNYKQAIIRIDRRLQNLQEKLTRN
jgi:hypothetical protein